MCEDDSTFGAEPQRLDRLLSFGLEGGEEDATRSLGPGIEQPGGRIGRYKLIRVLGEGGMGVVYLAEQTQPVRRQVALKIIKPGMDSKRVLARFEAEEQALALMEHPHVARVYDAGLAPSGRPYFVMEHVKGIPITEHCDKRKLTIEQRLQLFLHVCEAVQHAHQKGIIHRDLKPSNILVVIEDQEMIPKVIDFGVARAISQPLTRRTLYTEQGQLVGTPEYMSPEQANLTNQDVDTRTDIYSLGVVLYELITGVLPFDPKMLRTGGIDRIRKVICEEDPKTPSTRLSKTSAAESAESARRRQTDVRTLARQLQGDLDWITLKALEKDRTRRYATVDALAADIRGHLNHQPVSAAPPGALYRARKFTRRHRQTLAGVGGAVILLLVLLWAVRAHLQAGSERAYAEALEHQRILTEARGLFESRGMQARGTSDSSGDALALIEPLLASRHVGPQAQLLRAGILVEHRHYDEAALRLEKLLDERPEIAGAAYALLARIIWESPSLGSGELTKVHEYRQKADELLPETAEAYYLQALTALMIPEKLDLLKKALRIDSNHYPSLRLRALTYQASRKYDRLRDDALAMTILKPRDALGHSLRAAAAQGSGDYERAIEYYDTAIGLTLSDDPRYIELNARRCEALIGAGRYQRAIAGAQAGLEFAPDTTVLRFHIFCALTALGRYEEASVAFRHIADFGLPRLGGPSNWSRKYVLDALEAGRPWHPLDSKPEGPAFLPMLEAEETHRELSAKARRLITDGFTGQWSLDGTKVAFSIGVQGYSGVAIFDVNTSETELLVVPGKNPRWSPDGKYIVFVRDCEVLRVSEFTGAERRDQHRALIDEEIWIMKSDGNEPRRLAPGGWPFWSADSTHVYYHSREDGALCSISITSRNVEPKRIMTCANAYAFPTVSPDNQRVAYWDSASVKVKDLASQTAVAEWLVPFTTWGVAVWSSTGNELVMGGPGRAQNRTGLWVYRLDRSEPAKVLSGPITFGARSGDGTKLVFDLGPPYYEIWVADLDPGLPTVAALGPAKTVREHFLERIDACNRVLEVDPNLFHSHRERTTSALWIDHEQASLYLQELDHSVDRLSIHPRICMYYADWILGNSALCDRLLRLAIVLARKATKEEPGWGRVLAPMLHRMGQQAEAARLWQMAEASTNFLVNSGFEDGFSAPWSRYGHVAREVVTELVGAAVPEGPIEGKYCLYIELASATTNASDAGLRPLGVVFEAGKKYTISAFLKARKGTLNITFKPELGKAPWTGYGEKVITITETWAEYHVTTPVFSENVSPATFTFHLGAAPGGFWIDDVKFYEGDYIPTVVRK